MGGTGQTTGQSKIGTLGGRGTMELMEARKPHLELADVVAFVSRRYGTSAQAVRAVGGGDWSTAFSFRLGQVELIVRFSARKEDFENDLAASQYAGGALPVPSILEIGEVFSGYYAI